MADYIINVNVIICLKWYTLNMLFLEHIRLEFRHGLPVVIFKDKMGRNLSFGQATEKALSRFFNYILDLELLIVRIAGLIPIYTVRWLVYISAGVKIGKGSHLHMGTQFFYPAGVDIGEGTIIGQNAFLDGRNRLVIGNHVDIASDVMILNSEHDINSEDFRAMTAPVRIGDYVFIGPRAIILPSVKIGKGAVVAAGAVVTKDVEKYMIVGGIPAEVIGERKIKDLHYRLGRARLFQ